MRVDLAKTRIGKPDRTRQNRIAVVKQMVPRTNIGNLNRAGEKAIAREVIVDLRSESEIDTALERLRCLGVVSKEIVTHKCSQAVGRDYVEPRLPARGC